MTQVDALRQLVEEMRSIAIAAGQCSVEGPESTASRMAAAEADRCARWAERLSDLLAETEAPLTLCCERHAKSDVSCELPAGHTQNHKGPYFNGSIQWPHEPAPPSEAVTRAKPQECKGDPR